MPASCQGGAATQGRLPGGPALKYEHSQGLAGLRGLEHREYLASISRMQVPGHMTPHSGPEGLPRMFLTHTAGVHRTEEGEEVVCLGCFLFLA